MNILNRQIIDIPVARVKGIDELFGRMLKINTADVPAKFRKVYDETKDIAYRQFTMQCLYASYAVESMDKESIRLENGVLLESDLLADVFHDSVALGFIVVTLTGYDAIDATEENMLRKLFLDNWGTAFIECADKWAMQSIAMGLEKEGFFITHSFSPGQNDIPIQMQTLIFETLHPEDMGVTLNEQFMMHPKKTVSGIFAIRSEKDEQSVRPCDLCERRDTCPTAYV